MLLSVTLSSCVVVFSSAGCVCSCENRVVMILSLCIFYFSWLQPGNILPVPLFFLLQIGMNGCPLQVLCELYFILHVEPRFFLSNCRISSYFPAKLHGGFWIVLGFSSNIANRDKEAWTLNKVECTKYPNWALTNNSIITWI